MLIFNKKVHFFFNKQNVYLIQIFFHLLYDEMDVYKIIFNKLILKTKHQNK
jgi:hypothetical protein